MALCFCVDGQNRIFFPPHNWNVERNVLAPFIAFWVVKKND